MSQHLLHHHRRPAELRTAFAGDELECLVNVPLVHHDHAPAAAQGIEKHRVQAADMKQRHRQQQRRLKPGFEQRSNALIGSHAGKGALELQRVERLTDRPMRRDHGLGALRSARGEEDQRRLIRFRTVQRDRLYRLAKQLGIAEHPLARLGVHHQCLHVLRRQCIRNEGEPRPVADEHRRLDIFERIEQLVAQPPAIEGHGHRAGLHRGDEGDQPLRPVAHGDGDPFPRPHA